MKNLDCGCASDDKMEVIGLTNGAEICRPCFNAGADESNTQPKDEGDGENKNG